MFFVVNTTENKAYLILYACPGTWMVKESLSYDHDVLHITDNSMAGSRLVCSQWDAKSYVCDIKSPDFIYWRDSKSYVSANNKPYIIRTS